MRMEDYIWPKKTYKPEYKQKRWPRMLGVKEGISATILQEEERSF